MQPSQISPAPGWRVVNAVPALAGGAAMLLAIGAGLDWGLGLGGLNSWGAGWPSMKPSTALMLAALALALLLSRAAAGGWEHLAALLAAAWVPPLALGFLADMPLARVLPSLAPPPSSATSFTLLLLAVSLALLQLRRPPARLIAVLAVFASLLPLHRLLTFLVGHGALQTHGPFESMSLPTSLGLFLLACGVFLHPRLPYAGQLVAANMQGRLLRLTLPWVLLAPTFLAVFFALGIDWHWYDAEFAIVALVATTSVITTTVLWDLSRRLQRSDERRHAAEITLMDSEARANQIIESAPDAMLVVDAAGRVARCNTRLEQLFGYRREELLGQPLDILIPERFRAGHDAARRGYFSAPRARYMGEGRDLFARRKDGGEVAVEIGLAPLETAEGRVVLASIVDIGERLRTRRAIEAALREKTLLLNEIHHRVKNNLQIVASLLSLQAGQVANPAFSALIAESEGRVRAMALMHQVLYEHKDFARVELNVYLQRLAGLLAQIHGAARRGIAVRVEADALTLDLTRAIPLGLVVNELLSNAFKHAFPAGAGGEVRIELREAAAAQAHLVVRDNGRGLPASLATAEPNTLGLQIVSLLAEQVGAVMEVGGGPGARFDLRFTTRSSEPDADDAVANAQSGKEAA